MKRVWKKENTLTKCLNAKMWQSKCSILSIWRVSCLSDHGRDTVESPVFPSSLENKDIDENNVKSGKLLEWMEN